LPDPATSSANSPYFRPVSPKGTRIHKWDLEFESAFLQRRVCCELGLCGRRDRVASTSRVARADHEIFPAASLDTQLLLWAAGEPERLPAAKRRIIQDPQNQPVFSATSLWEVAIKSGLGRADFRADTRLLRRGLLDNGYEELAITDEHAVAIGNLPPIHNDPLDRMLVAQSALEGILLLTADPIVSRYPGPVRNVLSAGARRKRPRS
jgi:PIN domain nuclease of toxin-antitoxin system